MNSLIQDRRNSQIEDKRSSNNEDRRSSLFIQDRRVSINQGDKLQFNNEITSFLNLKTEENHSIFNSNN